MIKQYMGVAPSTFKEIILEYEIILSFEEIKAHHHFIGIRFLDVDCIIFFLKNTNWSQYLTTPDMGVSLNGGTPKTPQNDHF